MTTKIVWRLKERPTPSEIIELKKAGLLKEDEAREILFSSETEEDRDKKSLEGEIKFLRELVEKLSSGSNVRIVETIREVERPYWRTYPWYGQYQVWCTNLQSGSGLSAAQANIAYDTTSNSLTRTNTVNMALTSTSGAQPASFSDIKTF